MKYGTLSAKNTSIIRIGYWLQKNRLTGFENLHSYVNKFVLRLTPDPRSQETNTTTRVVAKCLFPIFFDTHSNIQELVDNQMLFADRSACSLALPHPHTAS